MTAKLVCLGKKRMDSFVLRSTFRNFAVMKEKKIENIFRKVPASWQICFLEDCPVKEKCLRYMLADQQTKKCDFGPAIFPTIKRNEKGCKMYVTSEPVLMAWGFETLFSEVKNRDIKVLRKFVKDCVGGHSNYYRYNNGQRLLTPELQTQIIGKFKEYGYLDNLIFDHYAYVYDFDH